MKLLPSPVTPLPFRDNCPEGGTGLPINDNGDLANGLIKAALLQMKKDLSNPKDQYYTSIEMETNIPLCLRPGGEDPERLVPCDAMVLSFCFRQGNEYKISVSFHEAQSCSSYSKNKNTVLFMEF